MSRSRSSGKSKLGKRGLVAELPISPLIDVVFLLLFYFLVSATIEKQETDISFNLPGAIEQAEPLEMPDEQIVQIKEDGQAIVNDYPYDNPSALRYRDLETMLHRFRQASEANLVEARITIAPREKTPYEMVVKVMDACSQARIENLTFAFAAGR